MFPKLKSVTSPSRKATVSFGMCIFGEEIKIKFYAFFDAIERKRFNRCTLGSLQAVSWEFSFCLSTPTLIKWRQASESSRKSLSDFQ